MAKSQLLKMVLGVYLDKMINTSGVVISGHINVRIVPCRGEERINEDT